VVMGGSDVYAQTRSWGLMLPFTVLAGGATVAIAALANRRSAYGSLARIPVLAAVVTVSLSIALGLLGMGAHGLFISYFCGQAIGVIAHLNLYRRIEPERPAFQLRRQVAVGWRHRDFARYTVPSQFLSVVSLDMPVYALTAAGSIGLLGAFHRARALVSMPLGLIGSAVAQVFRQRASEDYRNTGSCRPLFVKTGLGLFVVGLPPFILLMLYAPDLFRLVLGPNWGEAGEVARILAPMLLLRLVCSPLSTVFSIVGAQRESFLLMIYSTGLCAAGLALVFALKWAAIYVIYGFALTYAVIYIAFLLRGWALAMNPRQVPSPIQSRSRA